MYTESNGLVLKITLRDRTKTSWIRDQNRFKTSGHVVRRTDNRWRKKSG